MDTKVLCRRVIRDYYHRRGMPPTASALSRDLDLLLSGSDCTKEDLTNASSDNRILNMYGILLSEILVAEHDAPIDCSLCSTTMAIINRFTAMSETDEKFLLAAVLPGFNKAYYEVGCYIGVPCGARVVPVIDFKKVREHLGVYTIRVITS